MQVLTLDALSLDSQADRLAHMIADGDILRFDAIVGIRRGGSFVCDAFLRHFPTERYGERFDITLQRPSTKHKKGVLSKLLKKLPYPLLNIMRMAESTLLEFIHHRSSLSPAPNVEIPDGLHNILKKETQPTIMVIDDAIDSGETLLAIANAIKSLNRQAVIKTAVMTETTRKPRINADYSLYRNRTLIRFPWSNDYRTTKPKA